MVRLGDVELYLLDDGRFLKDGGGLFGLVPKVLWHKVMPADELNRVRLALRPLLIVSQGRRILVDSGLGCKVSLKECEILALERSQGGLLDGLRKVGYDPDDIDIVINTHLHSDHCGGNTLLREGVPVPAFPNAEYWIQRQEWADARCPNERTRHVYLEENLLPVKESGQLRLLDGDTRVTEHVRCMVTRGHTRAHQSVIIESAGKTAVFVGDLAPLCIHMERLAWIPAYDTEPQETLHAKRLMRNWVLETDALLIFGHEVRTPMGYLRQEGERLRLQASRT